MNDRTAPHFTVKSHFTVVFYYNLISTLPTRDNISKCIHANEQAHTHTRTHKYSVCVCVGHIGHFRWRYVHQHEKMGLFGDTCVCVDRVNIGVLSRIDATVRVMLCALPKITNM